MQNTTWDGGPLGHSFLPGLNTNHIPTVHSHRTRSIQYYHPHSNELASPNRATAKRTRKAVQTLTTSCYKLRQDLYWRSCTSALWSSNHKTSDTTFKMADHGNPSWRWICIRSIESIQAWHCKWSKCTLILYINYTSYVSLYLSPPPHVEDGVGHAVYHRPLRIDLWPSVAGVRAQVVRTPPASRAICDLSLAGEFRQAPG